MKYLDSVSLGCSWKEMCILFHLYKSTSVGTLLRESCCQCTYLAPTFLYG